MTEKTKSCITKHKLPNRNSNCYRKKKWEIPSPALTPEAAAALLRPCFLMMKLAPMNPLDTKASMRPFRFSLDRPITKNRDSLQILNLLFVFVFFFSSWMRHETNTVPQIIIITCFMIVAWKAGKDRVRTTSNLLSYTTVRAPLVIFNPFLCLRIYCGQ